MLKSCFESRLGIPCSKVKYLSYQRLGICEDLVPRFNPENQKTFISQIHFHWLLRLATYKGCPYTGHGCKLNKAGT